jgi:peptidyl-prolyl cis-trans isomerase D
MSVIQRIRDKGAWIVFGVIALALVAFILQDGVRRGGSVFSNNDVLGKVNGETINRLDFEQKLTMYGKGQEREQLIGQLWGQEVNRLLLKQEYDKLGLVITPKELSDILFSENSPLRREFTDPQTGIFDIEKAKAAFAQVKKSKNAEQQAMIIQGYIEPAIQQALQQKYQNLLQHVLYAPKWLIEKQQADNNQVAGASFVYVPYTSVLDSTIKVSDDEIIAYAKKHKKEYEREDETRGFAYVTFDASPSAADSLATINQLSALKSEFATSQNMKEFFAKNTSESQFYDGYISRKEIKQKNIDSITKIPVGGIYGPYLDGNSFVLAKVIGVKQLPDSAKVRHILISTHQPDQQTGTLMQVRDDSAARKLMDTVEMELRSGKSFDSVCLKYSEDGSKTKGGVYDYFTTARMVPEFNEFSFEKPVGSKGVIKTEYGYHYVEVLGQKGSGPAYKIAYLARSINVSNETDAAANNAAAQFAATSRNKKTFEENLLKLNKQSLQSGDLKENDYSVMGLGSSRQIVRWLYEHSVGDVSDQSFRVADKYVITMVTSVIKAGLPPAGILRPMIEVLVKNEKKAKQIIDTKFKSNTLEAVAATAGVQVQKADSILFSNPFIPGVGNEPKFSGAAFNTALKGKVSEPIVGLNGVFALRVENISAKPGTETPESIKQSLLEQQRMILMRGVEGLRKDATIKDYRSKFY